MFDIIDEFCNYDKSAKIPDYNYNTLTLHNEYDDSLIEYDILLNFSEDLKSNITLSKVNTRILSFISSKQYIKNILDSYYSIRELEEQFIRDVNRSKLYINGILVNKAENALNYISYTYRKKSKNLGVNITYVTEPEYLDITNAPKKLKHKMLADLQTFKSLNTRKTSSKKSSKSPKTWSKTV